MCIFGLPRRVSQHGCLYSQQPLPFVKDFIHSRYCLASNLLRLMSLLHLPPMKNRTVPDSLARSSWSSDTGSCNVSKRCNHWPIRLQRGFAVGTRAAAKHYVGK